MKVFLLNKDTGRYGVQLNITDQTMTQRAAMRLAGMYNKARPEGEESQRLAVAVPNSAQLYKQPGRGLS